MYSRQKSNLICVRCGNECYEHSSSCTRCGALTQIDTSERTFSTLPSKETDAKTGSARRGSQTAACTSVAMVAGLALCAVALFVAAAFLPRPTAHRTVGNHDLSVSPARRTAVWGSVSKSGGNAAELQAVSRPVASAPLGDADAMLSSKAHVSPITVSVIEPDSTNISSAHRALHDRDLSAARNMLSQVSPGGKSLGDFLAVQADVLRLEGRRNRLIRQALACEDAKEWTCVSINARKALNIDRSSRIAKTLLARAAAGAAQTEAVDGTTSEERLEDGAAPR
jgi:hypothetical protein